MDTNLRRIIRGRGLRQTWVAEQVGISHATMSLLANGKSEPTLKNARKIARFLGVSIEEIWPEEPDEELWPELREGID